MAQSGLTKRRSNTAGTSFAGQLALPSGFWNETVRGPALALPGGSTEVVGRGSETAARKLPEVPSGSAKGVVVVIVLEIGSPVAGRPTL